MKQKDILSLIMALFVSIIISIFGAKLLFNGSQKSLQTVEVVPVITDNFPTISSQYFNSQSIDPTLLIQIGNNNNPTPFNNPTN